MERVVGAVPKALLGLALAIIAMDAALPCDDPPNHYPEPCKAAYVQYAPYFRVGSAAGVFAARKVRIQLYPVLLAEARKKMAELPLTQTTAAEAILARLDGAPIRIIATLRTGASFSFYSKQSMSLAELKGNKVAIGPPGYGYGLAMKKLFEDANVPIEFINAEESPFKDRIASAISGKYRAFAIYAPQQREVASKYPGAFKIRTVQVAFAGEVLVAPERFIRDRHNDEFYRGVVEGISDVFQLLREPVSAKEWFRRIDVKGDLDAYAAFFRPDTEHVTLNRSTIDATIADLKILSKKIEPRLSAINVDDLINSRFVEAR